MPDEETLARWLDDELAGEAHAVVEAWAQGEAEWLQRRDEARSVRAMLQAGLTADEEVPSAEFFNARILREIEVHDRPVPAKRRGWAWFLPAAAAAGMVFGFWVGRGGSSPAPVSGPVAELAPVLYTPEKGVKAEYLATEEATVIVLAGVDAIPDEWELPGETAAVSWEDEPVAARPVR